MIRVFRRLPVFKAPGYYRPQKGRHPRANYSTRLDPKPEPEENARFSSIAFRLFIVTLLGTAVFYKVVKDQDQEKSRKQQRKVKMAPPPPERRESIEGPPKPTFSKENTLVFFILGGPGAGKGTQCANLVKDFGFVHLSAGDLLRAEQDREGSEYGDMIKNCIKEGTIVPMEVTVALLENAIRDAKEKNGSDKFLVDGFPRKMDQAHKFEDEVCESKAVVYFKCSEDIMLDRLTERGKTSGRADDNAESIKKRFKTFLDTTMPVINYFEDQNKVIEIDCSASKSEVYDILKEKIEPLIKPTFLKLT